MTSRERVVAALEFGTPDRVPFVHACFRGALAKHGRAVLDLMTARPDDFGSDLPELPAPGPHEIESYTDEWGVTWERSSEYSAGEVRRAPLADWGALAAYTFPPIPTPRQADPCRTTYALGGWIDLFERVQFLRGSQNVFMDLAEDRPELHALLERVAARNEQQIAGLIDAGLDGIWLSDDWGSQTGPLIDPVQWRKVFLPKYRRMVAPIKEAGRHVFFHSCGWTADFWDDLIVIGVDALNIQTPLFPPELIAAKLKGKVCVFTDVDRQHVLPHGSPADVREHIRALAEICGVPNGGVMMRGELEAVWPIGNIKAMYEAYGELGARKETASVRRKGLHMGQGYRK